MKFSSLLILTAVLSLVASSANAAPSIHGDDGLGNTVRGIYESAPDADGDGIPNGQDPDYTPPADGTGSQFGKPGAAPTGARIQAKSWFRFMWLGGLGPIMTDLLSNGYGPGDGTGNDGDGPADGTGYGPGDGTGDCDGTGSFLRLRRR